MIVQAYADGSLIYDTNLDGHELQGLKATASVLAGGTAEIILPACHPAVDSFTEYRTIVTIYRDGEMVFRGRPVIIASDFYRSKTITCEGERCFFRDAVLEPYLYQASPAVIFADIISRYNSQVDPEKQFQVGTITATDPNDYVRLESESATRVNEVIDKLLDRVGGYIVFTSASGARVVNWYDSLTNVNSQIIDFGENLLDLTRTTTNSDLATIIWPYGAKDETTGNRVTIKDVNGGIPYIIDTEAAAVRGRIAAPVYWDDVTLAKNLLTKARAYLQTSKMLYTSIEVSAIELEAAGVDPEPLRVGYNTKIRSIPHGLDDYYPIYEREYNLLDCTQDRIKLGWDSSTMTKGDVTGDRETMAQLQRAEQSIKTDYTISITDAVSRIRK